MLGAEICKHCKQLFMLAAVGKGCADDQQISTLTGIVCVCVIKTLRTSDICPSVWWSPRARKVCTRNQSSRTLLTSVVDFAFITLSICFPTFFGRTKVFPVYFKRLSFQISAGLDPFRPFPDRPRVSPEDFRASHVLSRGVDRPKYENVHVFDVPETKLKVLLLTVRT